MAMVLSSKTILFIFTIIISLFFTTSSAETCKNHTFTSKRVFKSCKDLPYLHAYLHWTLYKSSRLVHIAFRAQYGPKGWVAWAINPRSTIMTGSQALVATRDAKGRMSAYTTPIIGYNPSMKPGKLEFRVSKLSAEYANKEMTIFAIVGPLRNLPIVNIVWQVGSVDRKGVPQMHEMESQNLRSAMAIDLS
uniref:cytochrome b561 and DOMON domain-containing protein At5g47530-like n=1 Tax=Erigeron canadensis TaxID=72917 RepID=UPI001CB9BCD1|nr:cytochrome b561 and DOMON domain-containing protein At5g47530-like [Erigeron canadensis]